MPGVPSGGGAVLMSASARFTSSSTMPIAPSSHSPSLSASPGPRPAKTRALLRPIFRTVTFSVVVEPFGVTKMSAPFSNAKLPWTNRKSPNVIVAVPAIFSSGPLRPSASLERSMPSSPSSTFSTSESPKSPLLAKRSAVDQSSAGGGVAGPEAWLMRTCSRSARRFSGPSASSPPASSATTAM